MEERAICLRLEQGTTSFDQFKQIFPVASLPFVYFVGKSGAQAQPLIGEAITERNLRSVLGENFHILSQRPDHQKVPEVDYINIPSNKFGNRAR